LIQPIELFTFKSEYIDYNINDETTECKCMNGGICVLDNDFCVCRPEYTGRYCEINIEKDISLGCGKLLNNEIEISKCSKCKCIRQLLTCDALITPTCNNKLLLKKQQHNTKQKTDLKTLIKIMNKIEENAYTSYINEYMDQLGYEVINTHIDHDVNNNNNTNSKVLIENEHTNKLIVFKTDERIIGLYFPKLINNDYVFTNNSNSKLKFKTNILLLLLYFCIAYLF